MTTATKEIPPTTDAKCIQYSATEKGCDCPNFVGKGGSYRCPVQGDKVCKHMAHKRAQARAAAAKVADPIVSLYGPVAYVTIPAELPSEAAARRQADFDREFPSLEALDAKWAASAKVEADEKAALIADLDAFSPPPLLTADDLARAKQAALAACAAQQNVTAESQAAFDHKRLVELRTKARRSDVEVAEFNALLEPLWARFDDDYDSSWTNRRAV